MAVSRSSVLIQQQFVRGFWYRSMHKASTHAGFMVLKLAIHVCDVNRLILQLKLDHQIEYHPNHLA